MANGRRIAIGDIHGCSRTLKYLIEQILAVTPQDELFFLGDYIDRGPASKEVIDYIIELKAKNFPVRCLMGNHEEMLLEGIKDSSYLDLWIYNGGKKTLESFGIEHPSEISPRYMVFIRSLEYYIELPGCYMVHAGFNFEDGEPFEDKYSMLWVRNPSYHPVDLNHKKVIHGHTPISIGKIQKMVEDEAIDIDLDGGCVYSGHPGLGNLVALDIDNWELFHTPNREY